jgi:hypothetical protein
MPMTRSDMLLGHPWERIRMFRERRPGVTQISIEPRALAPGFFDIRSRHGLSLT